MFKSSTKKNAKLKANLFGSGTIMNEVLKAQEILEFSCKYSDIEDIVNSAYRWHIKNL